MDMKIIQTTLLSLCIYGCVVMLHCCKGMAVDVVGSAECLDCVDKKQSFSGMRVGIACRGDGSREGLRMRSQGRVDEEGRFRVPFSPNGEALVEGEECSVVVLHNGSGDGMSSRLCEVRPAEGGSCSIMEAMDEGRRVVRLFGKLTFSSSACSSGFFESFPWYQPKNEPWKKKKKSFLIFPFPPKCTKPIPLPTQPPPPPICDSPPPPPPICDSPPPPPINKEPPVFLPPPPPPAKKKPPVFFRPPPPAYENPPVHFPPPSPPFKNPPIFLPPPPPAFKNPPIFLPPPPPAFKNPPIILPPTPPTFENPPIYEIPFNPPPPPPVIDFIPVPLIPKFLPPKIKKPCPPVFKGPKFFPPKNPGHPKLGFWFPVPP